MLDDRPAEVLAAVSGHIDLFASATDIVEEEMAGARLHREAKNVAAAAGPDGAILSFELAVERIVGRNRSVGIDAEDFAEKRIEFLRWGIGGLVADGDVELAIETKMECAALVAVLDGARHFLLVVAFEQDFFAAIGSEAADHVMRMGNRRDVSDVQKAIAREVGIAGDADQASFPRGVHFDLEARGIEQFVILDDPQGAGLLADEKPAIGGDLHGGN